MNKGQKAILSLLVVIAVMLTLNLVVMRSQTANAEVGVAGEGVPYIVKLFPHHGRAYERVWSDDRHPGSMLDA